MSKKAWIIGGVAVVAVIGATIIGRSLAGADNSGLGFTMVVDFPLCLMKGQ